MDSIDYWAGQVRQLEHEIVGARKRALESPPCASFFVFFKTQKDAAIAAQTNIHPEDGRSFRVVEAPGPEEVRHCRRSPAPLETLPSLFRPHRWSSLPGSLDGAYVLAQTSIHLGNECSSCNSLSSTARRQGRAHCGLKR